MHRSGTSAVTRVLASLGCDLPNTLMEADPNNAMGYWESTEIADLNNAILVSAGSSWDDWEAFNPEWYASLIAEDFHERARSVLTSEFGDSRLFVLKDPRICRLLRFWKEAFDRMGVVPVVALPTRNPLEVAASLQARDMIDPSIGVLLWLRNVLDAEASSRGLPRAFTRYEDVLDNWKGLAIRLGSELEVTWPRRSTVADLEIESFIASSIRHHVHDDARVHDDPMVSRWVKTAFKIFNRWARGNVQRTDAGTLDSIRLAFNDSGPNFGRPVAIGRQATQRNREYEAQIHALDRTALSLEQAVVGRDRQIADLDKAIRERDERVADRDGQLDSVGQLLSERDRQVADRDSELASVSQLLSERDRQITDRDSELASMSQLLSERDRQIADRDSELASMSQLLSERDRQIADRDSELASMSQLLSERDRQIADRDSQLASMSQLLSERDRQVADRDTQIESLQSTVAERDARIESLDRAIVERDSQIEAIYGSTSWRITRPLRFLKIVLSASLRGTRGFLSGTADYSMRFLWRLIPLGRLRGRVKRSLLRLLPQRFIDRHLGRRTQSNRRYVASGRLQLADRNFEAANNQGDAPILFDPEYYLAANEDVMNSGEDPLRHYLEQGTVEGRLPFALEPDEIDPVVETLHRIDMRRDDVFAFDARFYRDMNPDLAQSDDEALLDHYHNHGRAESRAGSRGEFVRQICDDPREIPLDFKAAEYIDLYPDLNGYAERSPLEALRHYMCHGRWEPRLHTHRGDATTASPDPISIDMPAELMPETRPLCVLAHIYYPDLWEELAGYLVNLPEDTYDLYVNLVDTTSTQELEQRIRDAFPAANIYVSENVGRDIGGHFQLLRNVRMEDYRFFCLIHSKKSPHLGTGDALLWRRRLLTPLLGTRELAIENLKLMLTDDTIGLIGSGRCRDTELKDNAEKFTKLLDLLDVRPESRDVEFLSGTMMYVRREVLQRIFETCKDLAFEEGDDTHLRFHLDSQWAHAIERVIGNVVRDMNYRFEWR